MKGVALAIEIEGKFQNELPTQLESTMIEPRSARDIVFPSLLIFFNQESKSQTRNRKHTHTHTDDATRDPISICVFFPCISLYFINKPTHHLVANSFNFIFRETPFVVFLNVWNIVSIWFNVTSSRKNVIFFIWILTSIKQ